MNVSKTSGVYIIRNTINNKVYIGSSVNIYERKNAHFNSLKRKVHDNENLAKDYEIYKEKSFTFEILEECSTSILAEREKYFIDKFKCLDREFGYNICPEPYKGIIVEEVREKIRIKAIGRKLPEEAKKKIGDFNRGKKMSKETKEKMRNSRLGKKLSEETKQKVRLSKLGKPRTEETKMKISITKKNKSLVAQLHLETV
jgi:group I intron endonuclease